MNGNVNKSISLKVNISGNQSLNALLRQKDIPIAGGLNNPTSLPNYEGSYDIVPKTEEQTLETKNKILRDNMLIESIPYYETSNQYGETIYIGSEVNYGN